MCSGCKDGYYCNSDCQRAHWNAHKSLCKEQKIKGALNRKFFTLCDTLKASDFSVTRETNIKGCFIMVKNASEFLSLMDEKRSFTTTFCAGNLRGLNLFTMTKNDSSYDCYLFQNAEAFITHYTWISDQIGYKDCKSVVDSITKFTKNGDFVTVMCSPLTLFIHTKYMCF